MATFLRHPTIEVVRAELTWVQSTMANMRMKPKMQESRKKNTKTGLDQSS